MARRVGTFCWTLNNYTETEVAHIKSLNCNYMLFGYEVGEQGTPHLQGMTFVGKNTKTFAAFKTWLGTPRVHVEQCMDIDASILYCKKDGNWWEQGGIPRNLSP